MKPYFYLLLLPLLAWACSSTDTTATANHTDTAMVSTGNYAAAAPLPALPACYLYVAAGDTLFLRLRSKGEDGEINGDIMDRAGVKENFSGSFFGQMEGDTLIANHSYMQKGKRKVRQVAFLRRGDGWIEGKGPAVERNGIRSFSDRGALTFDGNAFQKASCL
ncbi:hypothetical protein [Pseudocnuella soli]|uniref:hypothetical protein n=1 Tax=Pseudocnuella soli TaxID=2502779 RepID=UPI001050ECF8|nr:hypothetical protein [Pseudocnuella soli]